MTTPIRVEILQEAAELTAGDRNRAHGDPKPNMRTFANLVDAYLRGLGWEGPPLDEVDGAMILVQHKTSRVCANKNHRDNFTDGSCYFAIGGECAHTEEPKKYEVVLKADKVAEILASAEDTILPKPRDLSFRRCDNCARDTAQIESIQYVGIYECTRCSWRVYDDGKTFQDADGNMLT